MTDQKSNNDLFEKTADKKSSVAIEDKDPGTGEASKEKKTILPGSRWYRFEVLTTNSAILRGSFAMNDTRFKQRSRGNQATSCSVIAIVFGRLFEPKDWTKSYVDRILEDGDKLFRISVTRNRVNTGVYLTTNLVYPEFYIDDYKCLVCTEETSVYGNLFSASIGCPDFAEGVQRFFKLNDSGVVTAQGNSIAVWRQPKAGYLYYDPSACGPDGARINKDGVACAMRFKRISDMAESFLRNLDHRYDSRYCIDKVSVLRVTLINRGASFDNGDQLIVDKNVLRALNPMDVDEDKLDCTRPAPKEPRSSAFTYSAALRREPLTITISNYKIDERLATEPLISFKSLDTGYPYYDMEVNIPSTFKELSDKVAILHGWTHESSEMYKGKGAQNVANCVAAVAVKKVYPVKTWLRPKLDEILAHGDALYARVKADKPTIKTMTAADLDDTVIKIDDRRMFVDVDLLTVVGTISSKVPDVLGLRQALEEFFLVNEDGIVECSSMALAVWTQDDYYYAFDPRQCDATGMRIVAVKGKLAKSAKKGDTATGDKKVKGKCCVVRFSDLDTLVAVFLSNIDPAKKNDRFTLRGVTVMDDVPGARAWKEFQPGDVGKTWILRGGISNTNDRFEPESQGVQGVAMPIVGLINATETSPDKWTKDTIDEAVNDGDGYYNWCIPPEEEENRVLLVSNAKRIVYVKKRRVKIDLQESSIVGDLTANDADGKMPSLSRALVQFFENRQYGIVEAKNLSVAVWRFEEEQNDKSKATFYYLYDANPRDNLGRSSTRDDDDESTACVVRAVDPAVLADLIASNVDPEAQRSDEFVIHELKVVSSSEPMTDDEIAIDKATPVKPDMNFYTEIGEDGGCLNGSFDQTNEAIFKHQTRDKQQAAVGLVALAMRKLYNPHLWYREVVDDILKIGDRVTRQNLENLPAPDEYEEEEDEEAGRVAARDYLLPSEIAEEFDIGVNRVTVNVEEAAVTGGISELATSLEEFFGDNAMGVFRQERSMLPIWKEGDVYFTMDPRGRDSAGIPKEKDGTATVLWFTGISGLASSLLSAARNDVDFIIDSVTLGHTYETRVSETERSRRTTSSEELWHNFPKKYEGAWELEGTVKLDDERFDEGNRKRQTAALATMAIIFSKAYEPRQWNSEVLDEVVITGDKFHSKCVERLGSSSPPSISEMTKEFFLSNRRLDLTIEDSVEAGDLTGKPPKVPDIRTGLEKFFALHNSGALTVLDRTNIAVWKHGNFYFCLVPFETGDGEGTPRILRFATSDLMGEHLRTMFGPQGDYAITSIDVVDLDKRPPWKFDPSTAVRPSNLPPLNAYHKLHGIEGEARAILRAMTHQGSNVFPVKVRDKQTASNCVTALAMSVVKDPATWTTKTLDEILVMGTNVHRETTRARPSRERIMPRDVVRVFHVGVNVMRADVEESTIFGPVAVPPPEPEVKGKGKGKKRKPPKPKKAKKGKAKRLPPPPPPPIYLEEGLRKFFEKNRAGVLSTGRYMVAVWKDHGVFFVFDPRARDDHGSPDDHGASCVMWFACFEPLYDHVFGNIEDNEKYGRYEISRVIVRTTLIEPLPCPAGFRPILRCNVASIPVPSTERTPTLDVEILTEYKIVDDEVSVLRGSRHMNDRTFDVKSRGLQSTAIAAVAIVVGVLHVPSAWTSELVDAVLKYGDLLHTDATRALRPGARNLSPVELLTVFVIGDFRASINVHRRTTAGILHVYDLLQALTLFFRNNCSGILHLGNYAVAVMQHYGKFYLFDPLARDESGRVAYEGNACVVKFRNIDRLAWHFVTNCNYKVPTVYTLNAVNVLNLHFFGDTRAECPTICDKR